MRPQIKRLTVVWRPGKGKRRIPVAVVKSNASITTFRYLKEGIEKAKEDGFVCFPDFPDIEKVHEKNVLEALSQRLNDRDRSDIQNYYDFWEVPDSAKGDTYRLLAYTQGMLATDNFEFLAEYYGVRGVRFVSEIAGLTKNQLENETLKEGDELEWKLDKDNEFDQYAVKLLNGGKDVGYVKLIHSLVFHLKGSSQLKVRVKKIEHNGHISRAFILIYSQF